MGASLYLSLYKRYLAKQLANKSYVPVKPGIILDMRPIPRADAVHKRLLGCKLLPPKATFLIPKHDHRADDIGAANRIIALPYFEKQGNEKFTLSAKQPNK